MGKILNLENLRSYTSARHSDNLPNWPLGDMLHVKVPLLAYRDYANDYTSKDWPFCWNNQRRILAALQMTVTMLKPWQATRRRGGAELILQRLEPRFPRILLRAQEVLRQHSQEWFDSDSASLDSKVAGEIVACMATAVGDIADIVKEDGAKTDTNPMLGSKILSFFLPDFFPIWDTAWIGKALVKPLKNSQRNGAVAGAFSPGGASRYAAYVNLMIMDAWDTTEREYDQLRAECLRACAKTGYDGATQILEQFYRDPLPVVFEACLLGGAARKGEFPTRSRRENG